MCQRLGGRPVVGDVVLDDQLEFVVDLAVQLVELQPEQTGVDAEFDDHQLDLVGDAVHHLAALHHGGDVAQRRDVFHFDRGEARDRVVEAGLVALEGLQCLVGALEQSADLLQLSFAAAGVHVDDAHLLAGRHDGNGERAGHAFGRAVAGSGLARRDRGVGNEVHVGASDATAVAGDDDRAVHLGEL